MSIMIDGNLPNGPALAKSEEGKTKGSFSCLGLSRGILGQFITQPVGTIMTGARLCRPPHMLHDNRVGVP